MFGGENDISELLGNVDVLKPRMGDGAAHKCNVTHAGHADITHILSASTQKSIIFLAWDGSSDSGFSTWQLLLTPERTSHCEAIFRQIAIFGTETMARLVSVLPKR
jgi:hypothetical protein